MSHKELIIEEYIKEDYTISEKLHAVTTKAIKNGRGKNMPLRYVGATVVIFLAYIILLNVSSSFRAFASTIPVVKESVKWFYLSRDNGLEKAVINESKDYGPLKVENKDYIIYLDHFIVDESRVSITAYYQTKEDTLNSEMMVVAIPVEFGVSSESSIDKVDDKDVFKIDINFGLYELQGILDKDNKLSVQMKLLDGFSEKMTDVGILTVKVDPTDISLSKSYVLSDEPNTPEGRFVIERLISYPSRTELLIKVMKSNSTYVDSFENLSLKINSNEKVDVETIGFYTDEQNNEKYLRAIFNDSCYYEDKLSVKISYDGYYTQRNNSTINDIPRQEVLPLAVDCYGDTIFVESVNYNESSKVLEIMMSKDNASHISNFYLELQSLGKRIYPQKITSTPPTDEISDKTYTTFIFEDFESINYYTMSIIGIRYYISDVNTFAYTLK